MGFNAKDLREAGFGVSGNRNTPSVATTNKLVDMMSRAKIGTGQLVISPTGTVFDAQSPEVREAPPEVRDNLNNTSNLNQTF